jgi:hypothetical protein
MRGDDEIPESMFSYVLPEQRVPQDHPLRPIRAMVDAVLKELSPRFARLYAGQGAPRSRPRSCSAPCCCRSSTRSGVSGN